MDLNEGTLDGNAEIALELLKQVGVQPESMEEYVLPVHGDLGTLYMIASIQRTCQVEKMNQV